MQLVAPDILNEARGVSAAVSGTAFVLGFLLWLLGWRGHRFWIVLIATISAGIVGLFSGPPHAIQPFLAGLLLAVAAGLMALALVRLIAFGAGGVAACLVVRALAPPWEESLVCFLLGGLFGLLLFRAWTMALTSAAGTLLMAYSGLCLANTFAKLDVVAWAEKQTTVINCACGAVALLGLITQFLLDRRRRRPRSRSSEQSANRAVHPPPQGRWWRWGEQSYRRAG